MATLYLEQAATAARAGASLIQVYVGRVRTWYAKNPDAAVANNLSGADDPGVELARQTAALIKKEKCKAKVIAASIRDRGRGNPCKDSLLQLVCMARFQASLLAWISTTS